MADAKYPDFLCLLPFCLPLQLFDFTLNALNFLPVPDNGDDNDDDDDTDADDDDAKVPK